LQTLLVACDTRSTALLLTRRAHPAHTAAQAATEVFVGGLSFDATEADLEATFSVAGDIAEARARHARAVARAHAVPQLY
jgi:hypothetical protein